MGGVEAIGKFAREHVGVCVVVVVGVCFVTACLVAQWDAARNGRRIITGPSAATASTEAEAGARAEEPERFAALRRDYDETTEEALAHLVANAWVDSSGSVVEFTNACVRTRGQGEETWEPYAVCSSSRRQTTGDGPATVWALAVETTTWREVLTLTVPTQVTSDEPPAHPTITCRGIASGATLTSSAELRPLTLVGPDEATLEAHGTTPEAVCRELAAWCCDWRPTATIATWDETILEDHGERTWEIRYGLDDVRKSTVTVVVSMDTHEVTVREGR